MRSWSTLGLLVFAAASGACVNMSSHQTAEVLKPGESRMMIGAGYQSSPELDAAVDSASEGSQTSVSLPFMEIGYRYGLQENLEVSAKATIIGTLAGQAKYQFLDLDGFDMAAGIGAGYLELTSGDLKSTVVDVSVPLFASFRLAPSFALYAAPQYVMRMVLPSEGSSTNSTIVGSAVGLQWGEAYGMTLEAAYMTQPGSDYSLTQTGIGFFW